MKPLLITLLSLCAVASWAMAVFTLREALRMRARRMRARRKRANFFTQLATKEFRYCVEHNLRMSHEEFQMRKNRHTMLCERAIRELNGKYE